MNFQDKIKNLITDNTILSNENDLSYYINDFRRNDVDFLVKELDDYKAKNYPYLRNLYEIISVLGKKGESLDEIITYLYSQLFDSSNLKIGTVEIYTKLYIKLSDSLNITNIKKLYDLQESQDNITISSIEDFSKYFSINEKSDYFIDSFFYNKSDWYRSRFLTYKSGYHSDNQKGVLELDESNFYKFIVELSNNHNLESFVSNLKNSDYENDFTQEVIDKGFEFGDYNRMYNFLISIIKYSSNGHGRYYRKNVYYKQIQELFIKIKSKVDFGNISFFQKLFNDINYDTKGYYYFTDFEDFLSKILSNENDIKEFLEVDKVIENNYILAFRVYQFLESNNENELSKYIEDIIGDKIKEIKERQEIAFEENNKITNQIKQEDLEEIEGHILIAEKKNFTPQFINDFVNKSNELEDKYFEKYDIKKLINLQLEYFCKWENLNPKNGLKSFKKTENGYNGFGLFFDNDLIYNILKSAKIIGFDLSSFSDRLSYYIPFIRGDEPLKELFHFCGISEIQNIYNIYNNYTVIAGFNPRNLIELYSDKSSLIKEKPELNNDILSFLKDGIDEYENGFYNKEKILRFLQDNGESEEYFLKIFEKYKGNFNHFTTETTSDKKYQDFRLAEVANEILIIYGNFEALEWRVDQIKHGIIENKEIKNGVGYVTDEINFREDGFIEVFSEIKDNDNKIINLFIGLIKHGFEKYTDNTSNYCYYTWRAAQYYFSGLSKISDEKHLIDEISKILSDSEKLDAVIYFKRHIDELEGGRFLGEINTIIAKLGGDKSKKELLSRIKELEKINGRNIGKVNDLYNQNKKLTKRIKVQNDRERFLKQYILIVEGVSDKNVIEYVYYNILGMDLPLFIQSAEGCNNIVFLTDMFYKSKEYKKIISLYDFDSAGYRKWDLIDSEIYNNSIYDCLSKRCSKKIKYDLLLPLPKDSKKLHNQVLKKGIVYNELDNINGDTISEIHYKENSLLDFELLFYGIHELIDDEFFEKNTDFPNNPITYKGFRKNKTNKIDFLEKLLKFYKDKELDLIISEEELFKNIITIIDRIDSIIKDKS